MDNTKALEGKDVKDLLLNVGSDGGAAAGAGGPVGATGDAPAEEKKEEKAEGTFSGTPFSLIENGNIEY